jgi:L-asparaginase / beta-aspartyl-peptidase
MSLAIPVSGPIVVVHGGAGAGVIRPDLAPALKDGLARAVEAGRRALYAGGNAVDAVVESVAVLENDELFNAGRGAVLTADGDIEHDAAVMDGRRRRAGAVAALCGQPNPIRVARALLEEGRHGMLAGEGAMRFAEENGFARVELDVLLTDHRRKQLAARQAGEEPEPAFGDPQPGIWTLEGDTVGAVVLDLDGHLAAGTSTGGIAGKLQGRVGDSPLVGGGLYANDRVCAVSATGTGERIMEAVAAHEVAAGMRLAGLPIQRAVEDACAVVQGDIGLIAVDAHGRVGIACNTPVFQRAVAVGDGRVRTGLTGTESVR